MPLTGRALLVPPSRLENNVLASFLAARGAAIVAFPALRGGPPPDPGPLRRAAVEIERFDWVVVSGGASAASLLDTLGRQAATRLGSVRVATIGVSAGRVLASVGVRPDAAPREHTAGAVASALGAVAGRRILLIREDSASDHLPGRLRDARAEVEEAAGYRVETVADADQARNAFQRAELVALANPTAARLLARALNALGAEIPRCLAARPIAAVGPATAKAAKTVGLEADLVAAGRLADLVRALEELLS